ncbi:hypothetical protein AAMO2058_000349700 [Amorphochlora amoebiformis]
MGKSGNWTISALKQARRAPSNHAQHNHPPLPTNTIHSSLTFILFTPYQRLRGMKIRTLQFAENDNKTSSESMNKPILRETKHQDDLCPARRTQKMRACRKRKISGEYFSFQTLPRTKRLCKASMSKAPARGGRGKRMIHMSLSKGKKDRKELTGKDAKKNEILFEEFDARGTKDMSFPKFLRQSESRYIRWSLREPSEGRGLHHSGVIPDQIFKEIPLPSFVEKGALVDLVVRMGTRKYSYPKHQDWAWNCLLQVLGQKHVTFHPPFPRELPGLEGRKLCRCEKGGERSVLLGKGEMIFIPPNWFHSVQSVEDGLNVSVNFFWKEKS